MTPDWLQWILGIVVAGTVTFLAWLNVRVSRVETKTAVLEKIAESSSEDREEMKQMLQVAIDGINDLTVSVAEMRVREEERR